MRISPWAWVLGLQVLLVLPFAGQPVHMDDSIYLDIGRNVLRTPWHAQDLPYSFEGQDVGDLASHSHPPFLGYWIGLLLWLFGDGPRVHLTLHFGFLIFPILFACGIYLLAIRFTDSPLLPAALAIASPAATVMSHNLMSDYPTLAFSTLALALYVGGVDNRKPARVWLSGIFLALAAFTSYPALLLAAVCWTYGWLKKSPMPEAFWSPVLAIGWMAAWLTYSSVYFGRFVLVATFQYFSQIEPSLSPAAITEKLLAFPILLASALALPLPLIRAGLVLWNGRMAFLWAVISVALTQICIAEYTLTQRFLLVLFLTVGGWMIFGVLLNTWQACRQASNPELRRDALFLSAWAGLMAVLVITVYSSASARYMLPLLPPFVLVAFRFPGSTRTSLRHSAVLGLPAALILGLGMSVADFEMARVHRDIARFLGQELEGWESHTRFGAEWGLRHYMLEQNFRQYSSRGDDFAGGQLIVNPLQAVPYDVPQDVGSMLVPVRRIAWQSSFPIRVMNRESKAGFYSSAWGLLPFAISLAPVEEITIRQVSYLVERLPEITLENAAENETTLPWPAPAGGVDFIVPPGTLRIPYDGPWPVHVRFSCVGKGSSSPACPSRVYYARDGIESEIALVPDAGIVEPDEIRMQFEIRDSVPGTIIVESGRLEEPANPTTIRNWLMLPTGAPSPGDDL